MSTKYLEVAEGKIAFEDTGRGPLVVCIPSMGDVRQEYRFLIPLLVTAGYRVVNMDVRGHGETSVSWQDYSIVGIGQDILALQKHLQAGPAFIIGASMGAGAAVWAASEEPTAIAGISLIGPFVRNTMPLWPVRLLIPLFFARPWGAALWNFYVGTLYPTTPPADFAAYRARLKANLKEPGRLTALRKMLVASKEASEQRLAQVSVPCQVIMGTKDPDFKDQAGEANLVASRLHGEVRMIEGAGHYPQAEMPSVIAPLLIAFFQQHETALLKRA